MNATRNVTKWEDVNRYGYSPLGLFVPYSLANLFALIIIILGLVSFQVDGVYPNKKFQDIASVTNGTGIPPGFMWEDRSRKQSVSAVLVGEALVLQVQSGRDADV